MNEKQRYNQECDTQIFVLFSNEKNYSKNITAYSFLSDQINAELFLYHFPPNSNVNRQMMKVENYVDVTLEKLFRMIDYHEFLEVYASNRLNL